MFVKVPIFGWGYQFVTALPKHTFIWEIKNSYNAAHVNYHKCWIWIRDVTVVRKYICKTLVQGNILLHTSTYTYSHMHNQLVFKTSVKLYSSTLHLLIITACILLCEHTDRRCVEKQTMYADVRHLPTWHKLSYDMVRNTRTQCIYF